ncbi:hypothetical protein, partial [Altererythrobacter fulvus]|uniref:hypothetical protein n=1 Tax=Caenibius fulvus TaxID=2126012 RepID=UPI0030191390
MGEFLPFVIPAQAGTQQQPLNWVPACAGMTKRGYKYPSGGNPDLYASVGKPIARPARRQDWRVQEA